eukprot:20874-Heterococcus_DN1.PRE.2
MSLRQSFIVAAAAAAAVIGAVWCDELALTAQAVKRNRSQCCHKVACRRQAEDKFTTICIAYMNSSHTSKHTELQCRAIQ